MAKALFGAWFSGVAHATLAVLLASCTAPQPGPPMPPPPVMQANPSPPILAPVRPTPTPAPAPAYRSIDEYKQALARHILTANATSAVQGDLDPFLRAVVVLQFNVDGAGTIRDVRSLRAQDSAAENMARGSLQRSGALPAPSPGLLQGGLLEITETWLFNNDGKFHLRTLGPRQRLK